ncbi:hypothetical protein [Paremcibacter congregatus]|uniref:hypothetical protein n=1 Tax=Paremcibacter congregatus TaxID=2043170 RepID=UPI0030EC312D
MAFQDSDFTLYGSLVMPEDDVTVNIGGGIDETTIVSFTPMGANSSVEVISDNAADTMNITITGRDVTGAPVSEVVAVNGTTVVAVPGTFKRLLKVVLASAAAGTITVRKAGAAGDLMSFPAGVLTVRRPLIDISADVAGGAERKYYEKLFYKNSNATDALLETKISFVVNPGNAYASALATAVDDAGTNGGGNNRLVKPAALTFDTTEKAIPGDNLAPGSAIGIWIERTLAAGAAAGENTFSLQAAGKGA